MLSIVYQIDNFWEAWLGIILIVGQWPLEYSLMNGHGGTNHLHEQDYQYWIPSIALEKTSVFFQ